MRSSNVLLYPGQYNQPAAYPPSNYARSADVKRANENVLPPLDYKNRNIPSGLFTSNPLANLRQLNAAPVLPNLKTVMEGISVSGENVPSSSNVSKSNNKIVNSSYGPSAQYTTPAPGSIGNSTTQYVNPRYNGHYYPQQQYNLNAPIKFIIHRGTTIYQGDHVSIRGSDSQIYFAILIDFWLTENGKRYCTLRWLLPKPKASFTAPLQNRFDLGPIHERVETMETILDVFYSPYRDQLTAESIRRKYLLSPSVISGSEDSGSNSASSSTTQSSIDPPPQILKVIKSLSGEGGADSEISSLKSSPISESASLSHSGSSDAGISLNSPSSRLFKSSADEIQMNPIISAESSEIAAKMLLSMN